MAVTLRAFNSTTITDATGGRELAAPTSSFSVAVGTVLAALSMIEEFVASQQTAITVDSAGNTWTNKALKAVGAGNGQARIDSAISASAVSDVVTLEKSYTSGTNFFWGGGVFAFDGASSVGAANSGNGTGAPTLSLTTTQPNSAIVYAIVDWNTVDGTSRVHRTVNSFTPTVGNGGEKLYFTNGTNDTFYIGWIPDAGAAGAKTVGLSAPTGQKYSIVALEIIAGSGAAVTGTGAATGPAATASGTGARGHDSQTASVAFVGMQSAGAGVKGVTGSGSPQAPHPATIVSTFGSSKSGSGAATITPATAAGTGNRGHTDVPGAIDITANSVAQISGAGIIGVQRTGLGALQTGSALVGGVASRGWSGSGALTAPSPMHASGTSVIARVLTGTGSLTSPGNYSAVSTSSFGHTGTGALSSFRAIVNGVSAGLIIGGEAPMAAHRKTTTRAAGDANRRPSWMR